MSEKIVPPGGNAPSKADEMSASLSSWIHFFHEPYKADWKEARNKAIDRKWKYEIFKKGGISIVSAYSDWKAGAISDDEYKAVMRRECEDHYPDMERMPKQCMDCMWRSDAKIRERKGRILKAEYSGEKEDKVLIYQNPDKDGFVAIEMCTNDDSDKYMTEIDGADEECRYFEEENC